MTKIKSLYAQWIALPLGSALAFLWFDVFRIRRRIAIENVALAFPELSPREHESIARQSLRHMGRSLVEYGLLPILNSRDVDSLFDFEGEDFVRKAAAEGKGVLLLSLHLGNGDLSVAALSLKGWLVSLISKRFKFEPLNRLWFGMRSKHGTQFIAPERSSFDILRALKSKRFVVFVLDQYMGPPIGCRTRFFGRETGTAMGLALMAERTGAPVLPCYTYRLPDGRHKAVFEAPIEWNPQASNQDLGPNASREQNIAAMTQVYTDKIEAIVRKHPEQWMWIHRRWKNFG